MKLWCSSILILGFLASAACAPVPEEAVVEEPVTTQADTGSISSGLFDLDYFIEGTGTPTIVIGFPNYYRRVFSQNLRSHLRLVFLDHRGTAPSPGPVGTEEFALERLIDDIELARQTLELGRVAVVGHSGHGFMALEYAKKYPSNVSHVIMIGIVPDFSVATAEAAEQYWQELAQPERKAVLEENFQRLPDEQLAELPPGEAWLKSYVRNGPRAWYEPRFDATPLFEDVELNMDMYNYVWGQLFREIDIEPGLEAFDVPVFLALGRYDFLVGSPSEWDPVAPKFMNLTVKIFEESGHTPQYEEPELFDSELLRWMEEH